MFVSLFFLLFNLKYQNNKPNQQNPNKSVFCGGGNMGGGLSEIFIVLYRRLSKSAKKIFSLSLLLFYFFNLAFFFGSSLFEFLLVYHLIMQLDFQFTKKNSFLDINKLLFDPNRLDRIPISTLWFPIVLWI